jgi:O-antigen/teichoic acid export membrane protein
MSIRRQSIISSIIVYIGFALGFVNTYLFAKGFSEAQYGLTGTFVAIATVMLSVSNLGMMAYIYKFFPYYKDNLPPDKNDMMTLALGVSLTGFLFVMIGGLVFKDLVIEKYGTNSPELIRYYYWLFPFGFGLSLFSLFEAFTWQFRKSVLTSFLKEILFRLFTTLLIVGIFTGFIKNFDLFIKLYAFTYIGCALLLVAYLIITKRLHFTFRLSRVTKKFRKKIILLAAFIWSGSLVYNVSQVFDTLVIGSVLQNGMASVGIYTLAQNMSSLIQAPQRAIIAAALPPLSQAWKDKDYDKINRVYHRSSINQLIFAVGMFSLICINFTDGVLTFHLKPGYLDARQVFLFIGLMRVIDLGTGLNSQIIGTSTFWRFEFISGIILLLLILPLNYILTKRMGVEGPAIANLISITIYNGIRYTFLLRKFNMQPFTIKTLYTLLLGAASFAIAWFLFHNYQGFGWIVLRSSVFMALYVTGILLLDLSPDVLPVWQTVRRRIGL